MKKWWNSLPIRRKLQLPIQLLLFFVILFAQRISLDKFEKHILHGAQQRAEASADGVLNGLNMLMVNGIISDVEQRSLYVEKMSASEGIDELRVIRGKAVSDQYGPGQADEQARDELDRAALETGRVQIKQTRFEGRPALRVVMPFVAQTDFRGTNCLTCHSVPAGTVAGAASITMDMAQEYAKISAANYWAWGAQIVLQMRLLQNTASGLN